VRARVLAAAVVVALLVPGVAEAHGLVQREQLPIPQWLFAWAAAAVLVISFFALAVLWPEPQLEREHYKPLKIGRRSRRCRCRSPAARSACSCSS